MGISDSVVVFFSSSYLDFYYWMIMGVLFRLSNRENEFKTVSAGFSASPEVN